MPTLYNVAVRWRYEGRLIDFGEPSCMACGWHVPDYYAETDNLRRTWALAGKFIQRAHLKDRALGGEDSVDNIVPLCSLCHSSMPIFTDRDQALAWVLAQPPRHPMFQFWTDLAHDDGRMRFPSSLRSQYIAFLEDISLLSRDDLL